MRVLLALVLLSGCAAPIEATRDLPRPGSLEQVNLLLRGKRVSIELSDGARIPLVTEAVVTPTDVRFEREGEPHAVPVADVERITYVRNRGTKAGALAGTVPGLALVTLGAIGLAVSEPSTAQIAIVVVMAGGALAIVPGAVLGGVAGQGVSPGGVVPLYEAPLERYLPQPPPSPERP